MNTVQVRNIVIGEGRPKICVPIVGKKTTDILEEAKKITALPVDVVEWRVDWFDDVFTTKKGIRNSQSTSRCFKRHSGSSYFPYFQRRRRERNLCKRLCCFKYRSCSERLCRFNRCRSIYR